MLPHRSTVVAAAVHTPTRAEHASCLIREPAPLGRPECIRDMDRRIAEAMRRGDLSRGAALALYGEVMESHPEDPCSAREDLAAALGDLALA